MQAVSTYKYFYSIDKNKVDAMVLFMNSIHAPTHSKFQLFPDNPMWRNTPSERNNFNTKELIITGQQHESLLIRFDDSGKFIGKEK